MKNEKVIYENEKGQQIEFSIWSSFFLNKITGIDGLKNNIYSTKGINQDGVTCTGSNLDPRFITIEGGIIENVDINRQMLLSAINPKLDAKLIYEIDGVKKCIKCKVEHSPVISKDFSPNFLISFYCPNPYWQEYVESAINIAYWQGKLEFPIKTPIKSFEVGYRNEELLMNIVNTGDVECGMIVEFKANGTVINPSVLNILTREFIKINKEMQAGDIIRVCTEFGKKRTELIRGLDITNISNFRDLDSTYIQLTVGDNYIKYNSDSNVNNLDVTIKFSPRYLGV